jgi:hypothetical protein
MEDGDGDGDVEVVYPAFACEKKVLRKWECGAGVGGKNKL